MSELTGNRIKRSRPTSPWTYRFKIGGFKYQGTTNTTDKAEAEKFAQAAFDAATETAAKERKLGNVPMTFGIACDKWLSGKAARLREGGLTEQVSWLRKQIGANKLLETIRRADITAMVEARSKCLRPGKAGTFRRIKDTTVNKTIRLLQRILNYAAGNHDAVVKRFVWKDFLIKVAKARPTKRALTPEREQTVLETINPNFADLTRFAMIGGLRASENLLRWDQIDWRNSMVLDVVGKGHRDGRDVPMGPDEMAILRAEFARNDRHDVYVFSYEAQRTRKIPRTDRWTVKGTRYPITYTGWNSAWDRAMKKAGLSIRLHDLRHTAITRAIKRTNGNVVAAQQMAGHADIKTTMLYWEGDDSAVRNAKNVGGGAPAGAPALRRVS
jgi:integrase